MSAQGLDSQARCFYVRPALEYAERYADQNELDYAALLEAEERGAIEVARGLRPAWVCACARAAASRAASSGSQVSSTVTPSRDLQRGQSRSPDRAPALKRIPHRSQWNIYLTPCGGTFSSRPGAAASRPALVMSSTSRMNPA
jgi:hypothetical protein